MGVIEDGGGDLVAQYDGDLKPQRRATDQDPWYTNKDLYQMIDELKGRINETANLLKQYNGLVPRMAKLEEALTKLATAQSECIQRQQGRYDAGKMVREWGGWIFAVVLFGRTIGWW